MKIEQKILAGLALAACAGYAIAQSQQFTGSAAGSAFAGRVAGEGQSSSDKVVGKVVGGSAIEVMRKPLSQDDAPEVAQMVKAPHPQNAVVSAMRAEVSGMINHLWQTARAKGDEAAAARLIEVSCWAVLASMTPEQQRYEINSVWQLGRHKPGGEWDHVASAPTLVSGLLKVDSKLESQAKSISDAFRKARMKPYDDYASGFRAKSADGTYSAAVYNAGLPGLHKRLAAEFLKSQKRPVLSGMTHDTALAILAEKTVMDQKPEFNKIRLLLTPGQQDEWKSYVNTCLLKAKLAASGQNPFDAAESR